MFGKKQKTIFAASRYKWLPERNPGLLTIKASGEQKGNRERRNTKNASGDFEDSCLLLVTAACACF